MSGVIDFLHPHIISCLYLYSQCNATAVRDRNVRTSSSHEGVRSDFVFEALNEADGVLHRLHFGHSNGLDQYETERWEKGGEEGVAERFILVCKTRTQKERGRLK